MKQEPIRIYIESFVLVAISGSFLSIVSNSKLSWKWRLGVGILLAVVGILAAWLMSKLSQAQESQEEDTLEHPTRPIQTSRPQPPQPDLVNPYLLQKHFTGRIRERLLLSEWLLKGADPMLILTAIGGMGKSSLAWVWLVCDVLGRDLPNIPTPETTRAGSLDQFEGVLWWSFDEAGSEFSSFLDRSLSYVEGGSDVDSTLSGREKGDRLLGILARKRYLFVLDGFERELRGYAKHRLLGTADSDPEGTEEDFRSCIDPNAARFLEQASHVIQSKVLITSRHTPRELDSVSGVRVEELRSMDPDDAVRFFELQDIAGSAADIKFACEAYEYHPLSLRLLAGILKKDKQFPGDVRGAYRYSIVPKGKEQRHILDVSYNSLNRSARTVLTYISVFGRPAPYEALRLFSRFMSSQTLSVAIDNLADRGLLFPSEDKRRYDLHPVVRKYAYQRLHYIQRRLAHRKLSKFYRGVSERSLKRDPITVSDLSNVIEWYRHSAQGGLYGGAFDIIHECLFIPLHFTFSAYRLNIELLRMLYPRGEDRPPTVKKDLLETSVRPILSGTAITAQVGLESPQVWLETALGISYRVTGMPSSAEVRFTKANETSRELKDEVGLKTGLVNLADVQRTLGHFKSAENSLANQILLSQTTQDDRAEAIGHQDLALTLACRGLWELSEREFTIAERLGQGDLHRLAIIWGHRARKELLLARRGNNNSALAAYTYASKTSDTIAAIRRDEIESVTRHHVRALLLMGASSRLLGKGEAEQFLSEALKFCRKIDLIEFEGEILLEMAWLNATEATQHGSPEKYAMECLKIAERCKYPMQEADAHLFLATTARKRGDDHLVRLHAEKARMVAECDGAPEFTYWVAYDEAQTFLNSVSA